MRSRVDYILDNEACFFIFGKIRSRDSSSDLVDLFSTRIPGIRCHVDKIPQLMSSVSFRADWENTRAPQNFHEC